MQICLENLQLWICKEFGEENKVSVSFSLPLYLYEDAFNNEIENKIRKQKDINSIISQFEKNINQETLSNPRYSRKIAIFVGELKNHQSKESINFAKISVDKNVDFTNPNTIVGLKMVSNIENYPFSAKGVIQEVKKHHKWFLSPSTHHSNAFKCFTDKGEKHKNQYFIETKADNKKHYSQKWIDFLITELGKDGMEDKIRKYKDNSLNGITT